jgi:hypothetical protein
MKKNPEPEEILAALRDGAIALRWNADLPEGVSHYIEIAEVLEGLANGEIAFPDMQKDNQRGRK